MDIVEPFPTAGCEIVVIGKDQPEYVPIPALAYPDGTLLIEWTFTKEERQAIARGENLRHWIHRTLRCPQCNAPHFFEPLRLEVTAQTHG
jgi:hypothetical protein